MTENEIKLINMIRNHNHPDKAMAIVITTICWYLRQSQSSAIPSVADFPGQA